MAGSGGFYWNDDLVCLAMGQTVHTKGCFGEKDIRIEDIPFILTKGTWPSLLCHK